MEQTRLYDLIRKYADDKATPEEVQELHEWYHTVHTAEPVEWPADDPKEKQLLQQRLWEHLKPPPQSRLRVLRMITRAAACLVVLAGAWMAWRYLGNKGPDLISIQNPSGKVTQITLPDSSHVWLNAASTLQYAKAFSSHREVFLDGEGYFDVAEDAAHPFVVHSGQLTTTVLGTSFNVRSFTTETHTTVTVIRGKVQVEKQDSLLDRLTPARQLQWDENLRQSRTVSVDTAHTLAWQHGQLQFDDETLEDIAGTLSRWYNVKIIFKDQSLRSYRLIGSFNNTEPLSQVLTAMSNLVDLHWTFSEKDRTVTLSGKGPQ
jgi:ferric-dicitrate binding protein FerR (iron transport regulator)